MTNDIYKKFVAQGFKKGKRNKKDNGLKYAL